MEAQTIADHSSHMCVKRMGCNFTPRTIDIHFPKISFEIQNLFFFRLCRIILLKFLQRFYENYCEVFFRQEFVLRLLQELPGFFFLTFNWLLRFHPELFFEILQTLLLVEMVWVSLLQLCIEECYLFLKTSNIFFWDSSRKFSRSFF